MKQVPTVVIRYNEVGFLWLKRTQIESKKTTGKLNKESFRLYKSNLNVSQNQYLHLFIAFQMHTVRGLKFKRKYMFCEHPKL